MAQIKPRMIFDRPLVERAWQNNSGFSDSTVIAPHADDRHTTDRSLRSEQRFNPALRLHEADKAPVVRLDRRVSGLGTPTCLGA
jgi:hypothetical protein